MLFWLSCSSQQDIVPNINRISERTRIMPQSLTATFHMLPRNSFKQKVLKTHVLNLNRKARLQLEEQQQHSMKLGKQLEPVTRHSKLWNVFKPVSIQLSAKAPILINLQWKMFAGLFWNVQSQLNKFLNQRWLKLLCLYQLEYAINN